MSARTTSELLAELDRVEKMLRTAPPTSNERHEASMTVATIFEEIGKRMSAALGSAVSATLLKESGIDATVAIRLGDLLLTELRRRGLEVFPTENLPPF